MTYDATLQRRRSKLSGKTHGLNEDRVAGPSTMAEDQQNRQNPSANRSSSRWSGSPLAEQRNAVARHILVIFLRLPAAVRR